MKALTRDVNVDAGPRLHFVLFLMRDTSLLAGLVAEHAREAENDVTTMTR